MNSMLRTLGFIAGILFSVSAMAAALIESVTGAVRAGPSTAAATAVTVGQRLTTGTTVVTGAKSQVILRFDDGQAMVLNDDTEFRIADYAFSEKEPAKDRFVFDLLRGAARSVTSLLTRRTANAYALRVPQATIGIRGTDYMVAVVNPLYLTVAQGAITAANTAGTLTFAAGATGMVASSVTLPLSIAATSLPAGVSSAFSQLGSLSVSTAGAAGSSASSGAGTSTGAGSGAGTGAGAGSSAGAAGAGAGTAGSAAVGGLSAGTVAVGAAAAAAIAGAISSPTTATATVSTTTSTAP